MAAAPYREGQLVWAKMRGHPYWPAKVGRCPKCQQRPQGKFWIFFYGTHEHAWMPAADLCCYEENREKFSLPKKVRGFAEAIWEIEEDPDLVITLGKPPSKRRRQSIVNDNAAQSSIAEVMEKNVPASSNSFSRPAEGEGQRYLTRRQKRKSSGEGIVAQITQNFAARMELRSPLQKHPLLNETFEDKEVKQASGEKESSSMSGGNEETESVGNLPKKYITRSSRRRKTNISPECEQLALEEEAVINTGGVKTVESELKREEKEIEPFDVTVGREEAGEKEVKETGGEGEELKKTGGGEEEVKKTGGEGEETGREGEEVKETGGEGEEVKKTGGEEEEVKKTGGEGEEVKKTGGEGEEVKKTGGEGEEVKKTGGEGEEVKETGGEGEEVKETGGGEEEEVKKTGGGEEEVKKTGGEEEEVKETGGEGEEVKKTGGEEEIEQMEETAVEKKCVVEADNNIGNFPSMVDEKVKEPSGNDTMYEGNDMEQQPRKKKPEKLSVEEDMTVAEVLMILNYNLKASLTVEDPDIPAAIAILNQLLKVRPTSQDLLTASDLVSTIRKVCRYSANKTVQLLAGQVYTVMKTLYDDTSNRYRPVARKPLMVVGGKAPSLGHVSNQFKVSPTEEIDSDQRVPSMNS